MDGTTNPTDSEEESSFVDEFSAAVDAALDERIKEHLEDYEGGGDGGLTEDEVLALIEEYSSGGGLSEDAVRDIIDEEVDIPEPGLSEDEVIDLIDNHGGGNGNGQPVPDDFLNRAEKALSRLELMTGLRGETRRVGPSGFADGGYHDNPLWGIHFETENPLYLSRASVDAEEAGSFHVKCWTYGGDGLGEVAGEQVVQTVQGQQRIPLEMNLDPGEYILARPVPGTSDDVPDAVKSLPDSVFEPSDDNVPLWRGEYDGWEADSENGLTFKGGANPAHDDEDAATLWYYFTDLSLSVDTGDDEESDEDGEETAGKKTVQDRREAVNSDRVFFFR